MTNTEDMWLVYRDSQGHEHLQLWSDIPEVGGLIEWDTGDDMELIGWTTEMRKV